MKSSVLGCVVSFRFLLVWYGVVWYMSPVSMHEYCLFFVESFSGQCSVFYCVNFVVASFCQSEPYQRCCVVGLRLVCSVLLLLNCWAFDLVSSLRWEGDILSQCCLGSAVLLCVCVCACVVVCDRGREPSITQKTLDRFVVD